MLRPYFKVIGLGILLMLLSACGMKEPEVVVYTSVDRVYSEPVFDAFYEETGIKVLAVYDVEASKTTGLVQRLIQEKDNPKADVFWNGEMVQMLRLKEEGVLTAYQSPRAANFHEAFVDASGLWTAFGGRARILLVNNDLLPQEKWPTSWKDLSEDADEMSVGLAKPMFGTTATHAAGLYTLFGEERMRAEYEAIRDSGVKVVDGNGAVRDMVVSGALAYGFTDTDDALAAIRKGADVSIIFPDQGAEGIGTMVIPNSVAMIKGAGNAREAGVFIDYLLSEATIGNLMDSGWFQMMLAEEVWVDEDLMPFLPEGGDIKVMTVDYDQVIKQFEISQGDMIDIFLD